MDTAIDTLVIEIESNAGQASGGIDDLISKLQRLQRNVTENLRVLGKLSSALTNLSRTSKGVNNLSISKIMTPNKNSTPNKTDNDVQSKANNTNKAINELIRLQNTIDRVNNKKLNIDTSDLEARIHQIGDELNLAGRPMIEFGNEGERMGDKIKNGTAKARNSFQSFKNTMNEAKRVLDNISKTAKAIASPFSALFSLISGRGRASMNDMGSSVNNLVKKLRMTTLALLGTRGAFTAIRKAVSEYMAYDTALAQTLQQDWAILGSLIAPILERIIGLFSTLVSYIATFIKMLTGVDLVARANKKSLGGVGSSAGSTAKKVKELSDELGNLQKFDDLNVVDFPKDSGSSGGGTGGGGGAGGLDPLKLPEIDTSPIDKLWEYIKADRWYALGMEIAMKFNQAIRKIDFDYLIEKAREWGKNFSDFFNGLRDGLDGELLGKQLAGALNVAFNFVDSFFSNYNFERLGIKLADIFNSLVDNVQWDTLGRVLTAKIRGLFETLLSFSERFNWENLGTKVGELINTGFENINLGRASSALSKTIQGLFTTASTTIDTIDWESLAKEINTAINNLDLGDVGSKVNEFVQKAYDSAIVFLGELDWEEIGKQVGNFLGKIDWVGVLVKGVLGAMKFKQGLRKLGFGFVEGFVDSITENIFGTKFSEVVKAIVEKLEEIKTKIKEWWGDVKGIFSEKLDKAKTWLPEQIGNKVGKTTLSIFTDIKDGIQNRIRTAIDFIKEKFTWSNIKSTFESIQTNIGTKFTNVRDDIQNKMKGASDKLKSFFTWDNIKSTFTTLTSKIQTKFGEIGTSVGKILSSKFNSVVSSIINKAVDVINGFIKAVNKAVGAINKIPGVDIKKIDTLKYPKLATGTNKIEVEGLYHLHQGEAVVPKKYNPAINSKVYNENNEKMLRKMDDLLNLLNNMETTNNIYIGNDKVHKSTLRYINREQNIYGTTVV